MRPFDGRRILLGISGGIASYKSAWLARLLTQAGAEVDVVMTRAATEFVGPVTFEALTGRPVHCDLFAPGKGLEHIRLAQDAHAIVIAPATADLMARAAHGHADDLLTACLLATSAPVLFVPAMNDRMWAHPQTVANVDHLRALGSRVLEPEVGPLAAGEGSGPGRMPEPESILSYIGRMIEQQSLAGRTVIVSAGPTREPIDPVRFISNRSSGRMGVALAASAWRRGADVELIAGHLEVPSPTGVRLTSIETTEAMRDAVALSLPCADVLIMAAAPSDYRVSHVASEKLKKGTAPPDLSLEETPDILATTTGSRRRNAVIVGFALETEQLLGNARRKLEGKRLDLIVANHAREPGAGFGTDTNRVTLLSASGEEALPLMSKDQVADAILDRVEALLGER